MTYLELINKVLDRLRLDRINAGQVDSTPFYRGIGAHVNDAKRQVEAAWPWGALRDTDIVPLASSEECCYSIAQSADRTYKINTVFASRPSVPGAAKHLVRQVSADKMRANYLGQVPTGTPQEFAVVGTDSVGDIKIQVFPLPETNELGGLIWQLEVDRVANQPEMIDPEVQINVPSLPVYSLALAYASRERGEVGGTPTSELFALADAHLADAIAYDSALYENEMDFFASGAGKMAQTNVGTA
jgi:hypothetical protein